MDVTIKLNIKRSASGWDCFGEEFIGGELCGAVDMQGVPLSDMQSVLNVVFHEYESHD